MTNKQMAACEPVNPNLNTLTCKWCKSTWWFEQWPKGECLPHMVAILSAELTADRQQISALESQLAALETQEALNLTIARGFAGRDDLHSSAEGWAWAGNRISELESQLAALVEALKKLHDLAVDASIADQEIVEEMHRLGSPLPPGNACVDKALMAWKTFHDVRNAALEKIARGK